MKGVMLELLRKNLLETALAALPRVISLDMARVYAQSRGFPTVTNEEIRMELDYLTEAGLLELQAKVLSPEVKLWKLTKQGRDFLAENE
jgi:hypothetical protein